MKAGTFREKGRKASPKERARVRGWVEKWQREFYLDIITVHLFFHETPCDSDVSENFGAAAQMMADTADQYHEAVLNIYPRFFEDNDATDQEFMVCHEMAHIITEVLTSLVRRQHDGELVTHEEMRRADERVTNWIAKVAKGGFKRR